MSNNLILESLCEKILEKKILTKTQLNDLLLENAEANGNINAVQEEDLVNQLNELIKTSSPVERWKEADYFKISPEGKIVAVYFGYNVKPMTQDEKDKGFQVINKTVFWDKKESPIRKEILGKFSDLDPSQESSYDAQMMNEAEGVASLNYKAGDVISINSTDDLKNAFKGYANNDIFKTLDLFFSNGGGLTITIGDVAANTPNGLSAKVDVKDGNSYLSNKEEVIMLIEKFFAEENIPALLAEDLEDIEASNNTYFEQESNSSEFPNDIKEMLYGYDVNLLDVPVMLSYDAESKEAQINSMNSPAGASFFDLRGMEGILHNFIKNFVTGGGVSEGAEGGGANAATPASVGGRGGFSFGNDPSNASDTTVGSGEAFGSIVGQLTPGKKIKKGEDMLEYVGTGISEDLENVVYQFKKEDGSPVAMSEEEVEESDLLDVNESKKNPLLKGVVKSISLYERKFSKEERTDFAKKGLAMKDGSFPIVTPEDLKNAIRTAARGKDPVEARKWIIKRAKDLKKEDAIPKTWDKTSGKLNESLESDVAAALVSRYKYGKEKAADLVAKHSDVVEANSELDGLDIASKVEEAEMQLNEGLADGMIEGSKIAFTHNGKNYTGTVASINGEKVNVKTEDGQEFELEASNPTIVKLNESAKANEEDTKSWLSHFMGSVDNDSISIKDIKDHAGDEYDSALLDKAIKEYAEAGKITISGTEVTFVNESAEEAKSVHKDLVSLNNHDTLDETDKELINSTIPFLQKCKADSGLISSFKALAGFDTLDETDHGVISDVIAFVGKCSEGYNDPANPLKDAMNANEGQSSEKVVNYATENGDELIGRFVVDSKGNKSKIVSVDDSKLGLILRFSNNSAMTVKEEDLDKILSGEEFNNSKLEEALNEGNIDESLLSGVVSKYKANFDMKAINKEVAPILKDKDFKTLWDELLVLEKMRDKHALDSWNASAKEWEEKQKNPDAVQTTNRHNEDALVDSVLNYIINAIIWKLPALAKKEKIAGYKNREEVLDQLAKAGIVYGALSTPAIMKSNFYPDSEYKKMQMKGYESLNEDKGLEEMNFEELKSAAVTHLEGQKEMADDEDLKSGIEEAISAVKGSKDLKELLKHIDKKELTAVISEKLNEADSNLEAQMLAFIGHDEKGVSPEALEAQMTNSSTGEIAKVLAKLEGDKKVKVKDGMIVLGDYSKIDEDSSKVKLNGYMITANKDSESISFPNEHDRDKKYKEFVAKYNDKIVKKTGKATIKFNQSAAFKEAMNSIGLAPVDTSEKEAVNPYKEKMIGLINGAFKLGDKLPFKDSQGKDLYFYKATGMAVDTSAKPETELGRSGAIYASYGLGNFAKMAGLIKEGVSESKYVFNIKDLQLSSTEELLDYAEKQGLKLGDAKDGNKTIEGDKEKIDNMFKRFKGAGVMLNEDSSGHSELVAKIKENADDSYPEKDGAIRYVKGDDSIVDDKSGAAAFGITLDSVKQLKKAGIVIEFNTDDEHFHITIKGGTPTNEGKPELKDEMSDGDMEAYLKSEGYDLGEGTGEAAMELGYTFDDGTQKWKKTLNEGKKFKFKSDGFEVTLITPEEARQALELGEKSVYYIDDEEQESRINSVDELDKLLGVDVDKFYLEGLKTKVNEANYSPKEGDKYEVDWDGKCNVVINDVTPGDLDGKHYDQLVNISRIINGNASGKEENQNMIPMADFKKMIIGEYNESLNEADEIDELRFKEGDVVDFPTDYKNSELAGHSFKIEEINKEEKKAKLVDTKDSSIYVWRSLKSLSANEGKIVPEKDVIAELVKMDYSEADAKHLLAEFQEVYDVNSDTADARNIALNLINAMNENKNIGESLSDADYKALVKAIDDEYGIKDEEGMKGIHIMDLYDLVPNYLPKYNMDKPADVKTIKDGLGAKGWAIEESVQEGIDPRTKKKVNESEVGVYLKAAEEAAPEGKISRMDWADLCKVLDINDNDCKELAIKFDDVALSDEDIKKEVMKVTPDEERTDIIIKTWLGIKDSMDESVESLNEQIKNFKVTTTEDSKKLRILQEKLKNKTQK